MAGNHRAESLVDTCARLSPWRAAEEHAQGLGPRGGELVRLELLILRVYTGGGELGGPLHKKDEVFQGQKTRGGNKSRGDPGPSGGLRVHYTKWK